jgi:transposase
MKDGKPHVYWSLVETIRTPKGPRQRVVGYLGELNSEEEAGYQCFVKRLKGESGTQQDLFKPVPLDKPVSVYPGQAEVEKVRDFGDAWVGVGMWRMLKLEKFFKLELFKGKEEIPWEAVVCFLVVSRFCKSMSKLALAERYVGQSALSDILGINSFKVNKNRLYRAMDVMVSHKQALGEHLKKRYGELFRLEYDLLLYDITSTYFEGECLRNPQAKRGYSRDKRSDCKQVLLALVTSKEGFPLFYEVFEGNRRDVTTLENVVEGVESVYGKADRVWVMDRGMVSEDDLEWLRDRGSRYIVGTPKSMLKQFEKQLLDSQWEAVYSDLEVKKICSPEYQDEVFVMCRSSSRREKEKGIVERFIERIEEGLNKLNRAVIREKRALRDRDKLQRKIGALLKANSRAARFFEIKVRSSKEGKRERLHLSWNRREENKDWADLSAGCYLLRSNLAKDMTAKDLWKAYINLTQIEEAFRMSKSDLGLRPVFHQTEQRVQAHIFICFLSLVLQKTFEQALVAKGLGRSTRKVLEELQGLKSMDVILPTTAGDKIRLKIISNPEPSLKILLDHLKLRPPKRLYPPQNVVAKLEPHL